MNDSLLPKKTNDPHYDIIVKSVALNKQRIKGARHYSQHRHNLILSNQSILVGLESHILDTIRYPATYTASREELHARAKASIEKNFSMMLKSIGDDKTNTSLLHTTMILPAAL